MRRRIGQRRWNAEFSSHNGNVDEYGQLTYSNDSDWSITVSSWPCELVTTVGGEVLRGRMTNEKTTNVAYGDWYAVQHVTTKSRVVINGVSYGITAMIDTEGLQREMRIELRGENDV